LKLRYLGVLKTRSSCNTGSLKILSRVSRRDTAMEMVVEKERD
jgi:hypothetical protein